MTKASYASVGLLDTCLIEWIRVCCLSNVDAGWILILSTLYFCIRLLLLLSINLLTYIHKNKNR